MHARRLEVMQGLVVRNVDHRWCDVHVEVTVPPGQPGHIHFRFADPFAACEKRDRLLRWQETGTSLTYVRGGGEAALLDDEEEFRRAFDGATGL